MDDLNLNAHEARVLGVLIEKAFTTPDNYPLSLNAATAGCNQKSNRNPVLQLSETEVQIQLDKLVVAGMVGRVHPATSRVERFRHNLCERLDVGAFACDQRAIVADGRRNQFKIAEVLWENLLQRTDHDRGRIDHQRAVLLVGGLD